MFVETTESIDTTCDLNSPTWLECCLRCGVKPSDLRELSLEEYVASCGNKEVAVVNYVKWEAKRIQLLEKVQSERKLINVAPKKVEATGDRYDKRKEAVRKRTEAALHRSEMFERSEEIKTAQHLEMKRCMQRQKKQAEECKQQANEETLERVLQWQQKKDAFLDTKREEREAYITQKNSELKQKEEKIRHKRVLQDGERKAKSETLMKKFELTQRRREEHKEFLQLQTQKMKEKMLQKHKTADTWIRESEKQRLQDVAERQREMCEKIDLANKKRDSKKKHNEMSVSLNCIDKEKRSADLRKQIHNENVNHKAYTALMGGLREKLRQQLLKQHHSRLEVQQQTIFQHDKAATEYNRKLKEDKEKGCKLKKIENETSQHLNREEKARLQRAYAHKMENLKSHVDNRRERMDQWFRADQGFRQYVSSMNNTLNMKRPLDDIPGPGTYLVNDLYSHSPSVVIGKAKRVLC